MNNSNYNFQPNLKTMQQLNNNQNSYQNNLVNQKINSINNPPINQNITFKLQENEIYSIKDLSLKRAFDIIKKTMTAKPSNHSISVDKQIEFNNAELSNSLKETRELFDELYNIDNSMKYYSDKMESKYK